MRANYAFFGTVALAALVSGDPAWAQDAETAQGASEIVVTARKREERLVDVPIASTALDAQALKDENIDQLGELLQKTPSATFANLGAPFSAEIMIRGVGGGRQLNAETATGQYRNGAFVAGGNIGGRNFNRMDFFDVARVEVLRGPQGALYGRNAVGGTINISSAKPEFETSGRAELAYGSNKRFEGEGVANLALSEKIAMRIGVIGYDQAGGDFRNISPNGPVLDKEEFVGARFGLFAKPTDNLDLNLLVDYFDEKGPSFAVFSYNAAANPRNRFVRNLNTPSVFRRDELFATLEANLRLGGVKLTSITYVKSRDADTDDDFDAFNGVANPLLANWRRRSVDDFKRFGQELRVASDGDGPFNWMIGGEYLTLDDTLDVVVDGATGLARSQNSVAFSKSDDRSFAVFGSASYDLTDKLNLSAEIRSTWDKKKIDLVSTSFSPTGVANIRSFRFDRSFEKVSPGATLTWKPGPDASIYLRYASGFRAGGFNNEPDPVTPERYGITYEPETTDAFELGGKVLAFDRRLFIASSLYLMRTDNLLITTAAPVTSGGATRNIIVLQNAGKSEQYGVEFEAGGRLIDSPGLGTLDLRSAISRAWGEIMKGVFAGRDVPRLREWQASASLTWRAPLTESTTFFFNYAYRGEYGGVQNTNPVALEDTYFHDIRAGLEGKGWRLIASIENIANDLFDGDKTLLDPATGRFRQVYTTRPRNFTLRASLNF